MIFDLVAVVYSVLGFGFSVVQQIFQGVGIPWIAAVCMMVLVSVVLRLFTTRFIGNAIGSMTQGDRTKKFFSKKKKANGT